MSELFWDLRRIFRGFVASPAMNFVAIATIAVAIGTTVTTYSIVEGVLLRSLPFPEAERLFLLNPVRAERRASTIGGTTASRFVFDSIQTWNEGVFDVVAGFQYQEPVLTNLGDPERIPVWQVTSTLFDVLGVRPFMGRTLIPQDDAPGSADVAMISHSFWRNRFGGDPSVLGRTVILDGSLSEIVGIMPPDVDYPPGAELWRAFGSSLTSPLPEPAGPQGGYWIVGRLSSEVGVVQALERSDTLSARLADIDPRFEDWVMNMTPLHEFYVGRLRTPMLLLLGAVSFVLIAAGANVASLLLARVLGRRKEIATQLALGSTRSRIVSQLLSESVLLALTGGALGTVIAYWAVPIVTELAVDEIPPVASISIDLSVFGLGFAVALVIGILTGIIPAIYGTRTGNVLVQHQRFPGAVDAWQHRAINSLTILQISVTFVLMFGAVLLMTSFVNALNVDPGVDAEDVVTAQIVLPRARYSTDEQILEFSRQAVERLRLLPGVTSAAASVGLPFAGSPISSFSMNAIAESDLPPAMVFAVSPEYFRTLGIEITGGSSFESVVAEVRVPVIVNEWLASKLAADQDPIGREIMFLDSVTGTIVGVAANTLQDSLTREPGPQIYTTMPLWPSRSLKLSVRTADTTTDVAGAMRSAIREIDPSLPIDEIGTIASLISETLTRQRFYMLIFVVFAGSALVVASAGVLGTMSFGVATRTPEFGIRVALGATRISIVASVFRRLLILSATGVVLGLVVTVLTSRLLTSLLFGVTAYEPYLIVLSIVAVVTATLLASILPAWRAASCDPSLAIRTE